MQAATAVATATGVGAATCPSIGGIPEAGAMLPEIGEIASGADHVLRAKGGRDVGLDNTERETGHHLYLADPSLNSGYLKGAYRAHDREIRGSWQRGSVNEIELIDQQARRGTAK